MFICKNKLNTIKYESFHKVISYDVLFERSLLADVWSPYENHKTWTDYSGSCVWQHLQMFLAAWHLAADSPRTSQSHQSQSNPPVPNNFNNSRAITEYKLITITQDSSNLQPQEEKQATGVLWGTHIKVSSLCFIFSQLSMLMCVII